MLSPLQVGTVDFDSDVLQGGSNRFTDRSMPLGAVML